MEAPNTSALSESRPRYWLRVLRPLSWWLLLVLVLYGIRLHQRMLAETYLSFRVTVEGKPNPYGGELVQLDGKEFSSGNLVSLGRHRLAISNPKTTSYTNTMFVWYGPHALGVIPLKRSKGELKIKCDPPPLGLRIQGPEFSTDRTNVTEFNETVPTDTYQVSASYNHWTERRAITVTDHASAAYEINPGFGVLDITCNKSGTTFELRRKANEVPVEIGTLPIVISELPAGNYDLRLSYKGHEKTDRVTVKFGVTNQIKTEFAFGTAILETRPAEATVSDREGRYLGQTPLTLSELPPGRWTFQLKLPAYEPATTTLEIAANETQLFQTNLISFGYTSAMRAARGHMQTGDYDRALSAVEDALLAKPNDAEAMDLQREAGGLAAIKKAKALASTGNYIEAGAFLTDALQALPNNGEALALQTEYKKHESEQLGRVQQERLTRTKTLFDSTMAKTPDAALFETHEVKTAKPAKDLQLAITHALQNGQPPLKVVRSTSPTPETFLIEAVQEFSTALATSAGRRQCFIVGGQTKADETQILYKVLEYKTEAVNKFSIGNLIGAPVAVNHVPIHASRVQMTEALKTWVQEGTKLISDRIQHAVGQ